jgi:anti-sigma factor RsiW
MKITRDVITDLYPLYESGEASPDTRELVAEFLANDPEFAAVVAEIQRANPIEHSSESMSKISEELEMKTLIKTRSLLQQRSWFMAFAILFSGLVAAFSWGPGGIRWIWADAFPGAVACFLTAIFFWACFLRTRRRLANSRL